MDTEGLNLSLSTKRQRPSAMELKELYKKSRLEKKKRKKEIKKQLKQLEQPQETCKEGMAAESERIFTNQTASINDLEQGISAAQRKQAKEKTFLDNCDRNFSVVIDCSWEADHNDKSLTSLTQQIMFCYGLNKRHSSPAQIYVTSMGERCEANLKKLAFHNWIGFKAFAQDYLTIPDLCASSKPDVKKELVYLTSDAEETLESLDANHVYIIGGIVDRNRLKGVTYNKAKSQGIRTAKLPIKEFFAMSSTHILTVNHVFQILLEFGSSGDWTSSISSVLPKRKELRNKQSNIDYDSTTTCSHIVEHAELSDNSKLEILSNSVDNIN